jgi:hypothetical protein
MKHTLQDYKTRTVVPVKKKKTEQCTIRDKNKGNKWYGVISKAKLFCWKVSNWNGVQGYARAKHDPKFTGRNPHARMILFISYLRIIWFHDLRYQ